LTQKRAPAPCNRLGLLCCGLYFLKKSVLELMKDKKKHLTLEGLQKIVNIRASMNKGHTPVLKAAFPNTIPAPRVLIEDKKIKDPN